MKQQHVYYLLQPPLPPLSLMQVFKSDGSLLSWFWNGGGGDFWGYEANFRVGWLADRGLENIITAPTGGTHFSLLRAILKSNSCDTHQSVVKGCIAGVSLLIITQTLSLF
jgi:hypothetical protein